MAAVRGALLVRHRAGYRRPMPLACPRCAAPMGLIHAAPHTGGVPVDLDFCHRGGGLWIDGVKLGVVCPTLAVLPARRRLEITLLGREGGGISRCPRCEQVPYEFVVIN